MNTLPLEKAVIAALVFTCDNDTGYFEMVGAIDAIGINSDDFTSKETILSYELIKSFSQENKRVTIETLMLKYPEHSAFHHSINVGYQTFSIFSGNATQLKESSRKRRIENLTLELKENLAKDDCDQMSEAKRYSEAVSDILAEKETRSITSKDAFKQVAIKISKNEPEGWIPSGFSSIDNIIKGFKPGQLAIIGARSSVGKTAIAMNMAVNIAKLGMPGLVFSLEMPVGDLAKRMLSTDTLYTTDEINITNKAIDFSRVSGAIANLSSLPMDFCPPSIKTFSGIYSEAKRFKRKHPDMKFIVIDYLQRIHHIQKESHNLSVGNTCKQLKDLSLELDIVVIALSQLNRKAAEGNPGTENLRDSGNIEEDADVIMLMHRENESDKTNVTLNVVKNRNGATEKVNMLFTPRYVRYDDSTPTIKGAFT